MEWNSKYMVNEKVLETLNVQSLKYTVSSRYGVHGVNVAKLGPKCIQSRSNMYRWVVCHRMRCEMVQIRDGQG